MTSTTRAASQAKIYETQPQTKDADGTRHWITRARNFTVVVSEAKAGSVLARTTPDEHMLLLGPDTTAEVEIEAGGKAVTALPNSLTIVPPGTSRAVVRRAGTVVRIFSCAATDLAAVAVNAATYADGAPEVAPPVAWPEPVGGFALRHYPLANYRSNETGPVKSRVFHSTNLMVNLFEILPTPRDVEKLSPHSHDDFEQGSLHLMGSYVHHLRYPWTPKLSEWRDDETAEFTGAPALVVIPAKVIHTSRNVGPAPACLVDIFSPPRLDFASKPNLVMNFGEYPVPAAG